MDVQNLLESLQHETGWGNAYFRSDTEVITSGGETCTLERVVYLAIYASINYLRSNKFEKRTFADGKIIVALPNGVQVFWMQETKEIRMNRLSKFAFVLPLVLRHEDAVASLTSKHESQPVTKRDLSDPATFKMIQDVMANKSSFHNVMIEEHWDFIASADQAKIKNLSIAKLIPNMTNDQKERIRWNDEAVSNVKLNDTIIEIAEAYSTGEIVTSMMDGVSAGGKTTMYRKIASLLGIPYYSTNWSLNADEDKIIGKFILDGKGGMVFIEGEFTKAFAHGGMYVAEELNRSRSDVAVVLNNALDDVGILELPDGRIIHRHPAFRFGMAINQGYAGTKPLDMSLVRRMNRRYYIPSMDKDDMLAIAKKKVPQIDDKTLTLMVNVAKEIEEKYEQESIPDTVVSIDEVVHWAKLHLQKNGDFIASAIPTIVNGTCLDREVNTEVLENIVKKYAN